MKRHLFPSTFQSCPIKLSCNTCNSEFASQHQFEAHKQICKAPPGILAAPLHEHDVLAPTVGPSGDQALLPVNVEVNNHTIILRRSYTLQRLHNKPNGQGKVLLEENTSSLEVEQRRQFVAATVLIDDESKPPTMIGQQYEIITMNVDKHKEDTNTMMRRMVKEKKEEP